MGLSRLQLAFPETDPAGSRHEPLTRANCLHSLKGGGHGRHPFGVGKGGRRGVEAFVVLAASCFGAGGWGRLMVLLSMPIIGTIVLIFGYVYVHGTFYG